MKPGVLMFCIVLTLSIYSFSQDLSPWQAGGYVALSPSLNFNHLSLDAFGLINGNFLSLGLGIKSYLGLNYDAFFLAPYVRAELGWFYLGAGPLFLLQQPTDPAITRIENDVSFLATAGIAIPIWKHDYGRLVFTTGLDVSATPSRVISPDTDNIIAKILITIFATSINFIANSIKFNIGLGYYQYF